MNSRQNNVTSAKFGIYTSYTSQFSLVSDISIAKKSFNQRNATILHGIHLGYLLGSMIF